MSYSQFLFEQYVELEETLSLAVFDEDQQWSVSYEAGKYVHC